MSWRPSVSALYGTVLIDRATKEPPVPLIEEFENEIQTQ